MAGHACLDLGRDRAVVDSGIRVAQDCPGAGGFECSPGLSLAPGPGVLLGSDTDSYTGPAYLKEKGAWNGLCDLVVEPTPGHFCKLTYQSSPFFQPIDDISPDSASTRFVELIRATEEAWPELCRAFVKSGQSEARTATREEPLDYVRTRTPEMSLVHPNGETRSLLELSSRRPVLLVFAPADKVPLSTTFALLPLWAGAIGAVDVVPVLADALRSDPPSPTPDAALFDEGSRVASLFGAGDTGPTAVLLGADGLLAGGLVHGTDAVARLVATLRTHLLKVRL